MSVNVNYSICMQLKVFLSVNVCFDICMQLRKNSNYFVDAIYYCMEIEM